MNRRFKLFRALKIAVMITLFINIAGFGTMYLWNWLVPLLFHGPVVTFLQALGLLVLSKILFGGFGRSGRGFSGSGQYHGRYSFDTFSHKKAVMKAPTWFDPAIKYPPFKGKMKLFKMVIK